ncbi:MAG: NAD-dependent epimerase/dehydratase family protein [Bacteroidia bacterium]|nr:NAD-dependent epimerase/dehydratase family protein [Bacteroidia bacterium]
MKCFVTGGAGFIGSHLVDRLIQEGHSVTVYDNLSLGRESFIQHHYSNKDFKFVMGDLLDFELLKLSLLNFDIVFHLAANSDIVKSASHTKIDLEQGTIATYNLLEAMRSNGIKKIAFTSSNVVYGEAKKLPIPEDYGPLFPISMYGASKLACEALISAYCHNFGMTAWIYRFANVTGPRITHGVVLDFYRKLEKNPLKLEILGDGKQAKPYIVVHDIVDGMLFGIKNSNEWINYFNLGTEGSTCVLLIAKEIIKVLGLSEVKLGFTGGDRGWPGDVARVSLDMSKLSGLGWRPKYTTSNEACMVGLRLIIEDLKSRDIQDKQAELKLNH